MLPFDSISSKYYQARFGYSSTEAGSIISIPFVMSIIITPIFGAMIDRIGKRGLMLIVGAGIMSLFHVLMLLTPDSYQPVLPIIYLFIYGIGFSLFGAVYWAALGFVVEAEVLGTANGTMFSMKSIGLIRVPIIDGFLIDHTEKYHGYFWVSFLLAIMAGLAFIT